MLHVLCNAKIREIFYIRKKKITNVGNLNDLFLIVNEFE